MRNLKDWLFYLENRHAQEIQLGLDRIREVARRLDLLSPSATVITVAGTNGKGSTVASLEALYCSAGYTVASYTSPHLLFFNERIKINQQAITDDELISAFEIIEEVRADIPITYFEMATLAALLYFKRCQPQMIILEVGMGGRLDATNIIDNDLAIITTIALDHQSSLGDTLEAIGGEKAGILRSHKPFIYADDNPPKSILTRAEFCQSKIFRKGIDYHFKIHEEHMTFFYADQSIELPRLTLHPHSIMAAIMATFCLKKKLSLTDAEVIDGIKQINLAGRLHLSETNGMRTLFDVSHNPQSVEYLVQFIKKQTYNALHVVFAALADKDISGMIIPLAPLTAYWYLAELTGKRALLSQQLLTLLNKFDDNRTKLCHNDPVLAYEAACNRAQMGDLIVVYGSFMTVGAVLGR